MTGEQADSAFAKKLYVFLETQGRADLVPEFRKLLFFDRTKRSVKAMIREQFVEGGLSAAQADRIIQQIGKVYERYTRKVHSLHKAYPKKVVPGKKPVQGGLPSLGKRKS